MTCYTKSIMSRNSLGIVSIKTAYCPFSKKIVKMPIRDHCAMRRQNASRTVGSQTSGDMMCYLITNYLRTGAILLGFQGKQELFVDHEHIVLGVAHGSVVIGPQECVALFTINHIQSVIPHLQCILNQIVTMRTKTKTYSTGAVLMMVLICLLSVSCE